MAEHPTEPDARVGIDLDAVIRRSRARRRPKQLLVGGAGVLAVAALVVPVVSISGMFGGAGGASTVAGSAPESAKDAGDDGAVTSAEEAAGGAQSTGAYVEPCGARLDSLGLSEQPLSVTVEFDTVLESLPSILVGTATLTNTGDAPVDAGTQSAAIVMLSQDGVVVAHGPTVVDLSYHAVQLDPGQSMEFPARVVLATCVPGDGDAVDPDPASVPLPDGAYEATATMDVDLDGPGIASGESMVGESTVRVGGPPTELTLPR